MYDLDHDEAPVHNESTKGRQKKDSLDEDNLMSTLLLFIMFANNISIRLQNIATKDLATEAIENDLLVAKIKGQEQTNMFVKERLILCAESNTKFRDPLHQNKILTFASLYDSERTASSSSKVKTLKADRCVLQRFIIAYERGRSVNIDIILCHELHYQFH